MIRVILYSFIILMIIGCGGGGSSTTSVEDSNSIVGDKLVAKITNYINDENTTTNLILDDYQNAGIIGVTTNNIDIINKQIESLSTTDIYTKEEIQALVDKYKDDIIAPKITLNGEEYMDISKGEAYIEEGARAIDNIDGVVNVDINGSVDINTIGEYTIIYTAKDNAGNIITANRIVNVFLLDNDTLMVPPTMDILPTLPEIDGETV